MTRWKSAFKIALATGCAIVAVPAFAEEEVAPDGAADIVVSGKREQYRGDVPLKEVPQSVQEIDGKMLADLNITRLDAALDLASGISRQNNFGGLWDSFAIRGFAGDENFPSGFLVNGFNGGRGFGGPRDASNIERIDILKGPNGAVFGRGEPGGTVNIITKKAKTDDTFGSFAISGGSYNTYRIEGDFNLKLADNFKYAVHLSRMPTKQVPLLAGQTLQLVPVGIDIPQKAGMPMKVRVYFQGKPAAGAQVMADYVNDPDEAAVKTDKDGFATVKVRNQGINVLMAIFVSPTDNPVKYQQLEHRASLSFVLPHLPE